MDTITVLSFSARRIGYRCSSDEQARQQLHETRRWLETCRNLYEETGLLSTAPTWLSHTQVASGASLVREYHYYHQRMICLLMRASTTHPSPTVVSSHEVLVDHHLRPKVMESYVRNT